MTLASNTLLRDRLAYSIAEASALTGIGRTTLYKLMEQGDLRTCKIGRRRLIPSQALSRLVSQDDLASRPGEGRQ